MNQSVEHRRSQEAGVTTKFERALNATYLIVWHCIDLNLI